ncbi:hypothetical protein ASPWEDRAFT_290217 [Aspergillus wentii DTO 134E9]|uniref:5-formyltetrahydrofolate cyclo-ligase n=1 Tax=Aspergillus wentii DTO 134E9 TaxID=1073089 RepID=A0A1L9S407_ASPWE|nr:uncharacterized protein ASPWEDRAFT_290217 [Aspergillus wentii DTO 134E9]KAI9930225.1 hypothetical protein MW887_012037 [Aspergillus wentii]OJJ41900.1 hypothetical protein ASPWEDRAFT_290217 [Aspergillus wentii DTO 134E9]
MMAGLQTAKKDLRRRMRDVLKNIPNESILNQSKVATNKLFSLSEYQNAKRIGVYLSMPFGELATTSIIQDALTNGKEVFIPYIHSIESPSTQKKTSIMDMLALGSMEEFRGLEPDKWGIPSLKETQVINRKNCLGGYGVQSLKAEEQATHGLDLIVMPGMAFDPELRRLGHGKGYYDHFLTRYSKQEADSKPSKMPFLGEKAARFTVGTTKKHSLTRPHTVALSLKEQVLPPTEEIPVADHDWPLDAIIVGDDQFFVHKR